MPNFNQSSKTPSVLIQGPKLSSKLKLGLKNKKMLTSFFKTPLRNDWC